MPLICFVAPCLAGPMLLCLADAYVRAINEGVLPTISTAWQSVLTIETQKAVESASAHFHARIRAVTEVDPILSGDEYTKAVSSAREEALALFHRHALGEAKAQFEAKLVQAIAQEEETADALRHAKSNAMCAELATRLSTRLRTEAQSGTPTGLGPFISDTLREYLTQSRGPARDKSLMELATQVSDAISFVVRRLEADAAASVERAAAQAEKATSAADARAAAAEAAAKAADERATMANAATQREAQTAEAARAQLADVQASLTVVQADLRSNNRELSTANAELVKAQASAAAAQAEARGAKSEVSRCAEEIRSLHSRLTVVEAERVEADGRARAAAAASTEAERSHSSALSDLRSQLAAAQAAHQAAMSELRAQLATAQAALKGQQSSVDELHSQLASAQAALEDAPSRSQLERARRDCELRDVEVKRLKTQLSEKTERLTGVEAALNAALAAAPPPPPADDAPSAGSKRQRSSEVRPSLGSVAEGSAAEEEVEPNVSHTPVESEASPASQGGATSSSGRRSSILDPSMLSVPVLQSKLRAVLGRDAKLPKKKNELIALALEHAITG